MARKILITSGKGGVGKTTVAGNLGIYLSSVGKRVVLIDVDYGLNNLDLMLSVEDKVCYDLSDVFNGRCRIKQALIEADGRKNLFVLTSDNLKNTAFVSGQNLKIITESLSGVFDYVLLDCPAGIGEGFLRAASCTDEAIIVTTTTSASLRDADKVISILKSFKTDKLGLVVNRVRGDLVLSEKTFSPEDVSSIIKCELVGVIPESDDILLRNGKIKKGEIKKAFKLLGENVDTGSRKIYDATKNYRGFFGEVKRFLKASV